MISSSIFLSAFIVVGLGVGVVGAIVLSVGTDVGAGVKVEEGEGIGVLEGEGVSVISIVGVGVGVDLLSLVPHPTIIKIIMNDKAIVRYETFILRFIFQFNTKSRNRHGVVFLFYNPNFPAFFFFSIDVRLSFNTNDNSISNGGFASNISNSVAV